MKKYKPYLTRVDLVKNQVERERIQEQEAAKKRKQRIQEQNRKNHLRYQEQLRSEMAARYFHSVMSTGGEADTFSNTKSLNFDGIDAYLTGASNYTELNGTTKASWSIWLKPNLSGTQVISRVSNSTSSTAFVYQFVILASGEVFMQINDTTRRSRTGTNVLTANVWSHILVTYDGTLANGSKTKMFINGVDSTSTDTTAATSLNPANYSLQIGRRDFGTVINYGGLMDEFALWAGTDFRDDVDTIYNSGVPNDLNNNGLTAPTTWYRIGDDATVVGDDITIPDQIGTYNLTSEAMVAGDIQEDVPTN